MNKKLFSLLILLLVAIISVGSVYAFDLGSLFGDDSQGVDNSQNSNLETINIEGIDFNIPEDFELLDEGQFNQTINDMPYLTTMKKYHKGNEEIKIIVCENPDHEATQDTAREMGGNGEEINGIEGYLTYTPENVTEGNPGNSTIYVTFPQQYTFSYAKDGKLVTVSATEKEYLSDVIIK